MSTPMPTVLSDRIFLAFMVAVGALCGVITAMYPEVHAYRLPPYFWIMGAMALFEGLKFALGYGGPETMGMGVRLVGFGLAIALLVGIPLVYPPPA
jgi:hypothetical protein